MSTSNSRFTSLSKICLLGLTLTFGIPLNAEILVQFRSPYWGTMDVELYDQDKPITVRNFIRYVQSGRYEGGIAHRCPTNLFGITSFVVQGGSWKMTNTGSGLLLTKIPRFGPIQNEFSVGRTFSNTYGTLAMAKKAGDTNSASSDWFFNLKDNSFLDAPTPNGYFTVFGRVLRGTNVLNRFIGRSLNFGLHDLSFIDPGLKEFPAAYNGTNLPPSNLFEYFDITLLSVEITQTNNTQEVAWNSVAGVPNVVEHTSTMPPVWTTLLTTNGTGSRITVTDSHTNDSRFYRVRVLY